LWLSFITELPRDAKKSLRVLCVSASLRAFLFLVVACPHWVFDTKKTLLNVDNRDAIYD